MNTELDMKGVNKATIARLQSQIEHLEVMLQEKESQFLSIPEDNSRQLSILCLETQVEELQNEVVLKNRELQKGMELLKDKQVLLNPKLPVGFL
jgi:ATP/maltotriose-dependent transcriptional regulator MalT